LFIYLSTIPRKRFAFVSSAGHAIFPDHALERPLESAHRNAGRRWPHDPTWQAVIASWAKSHISQPPPAHHLAMLAFG
jgi:hypothetical protein